MAVVLIRAPALQGNNNNGDINQVMVKEETFTLRTVRFVSELSPLRKRTTDRGQSGKVLRSTKRKARRPHCGMHDVAASQITAPSNVFYYYD